MVTNEESNIQVCLGSFKLYFQSSRHLRLLLSMSISTILIFLISRSAPGSGGSEQDERHKSTGRGAGTRGLLHDAAMRTGQGVLRNEACGQGDRSTSRGDTPHIGQLVQVGTRTTTNYFYNGYWSQLALAVNGRRLL